MSPYIFISRDSLGNASQYEVVSVIEYRGTLTSSGHSVGHYICDLKEKSSRIWFRTNDNDDPLPIDQEEVTNSAYVILYKRIFD